MKLRTVLMVAMIRNTVNSTDASFFVLIKCERKYTENLAYA